MKVLRIYTHNPQYADHHEVKLLVDEMHLRLLEVVAEAAQGYRAAMRRYIAAQAELLDRGVPLDEVTERNWDRFAETLRAEERLYEMLDALDAPRTMLSSFI